jgi:Raf kinase inhibitor-like YbhB/YbcL family protein
MTSVLRLSSGALLALVALVACGSDAKKSAPTTTTPTTVAPTTTTTAPATKIVVTSTAFTNNAPIPRQYSCDGGNTIVPVAWTGIPPEATSVALEVHDPDAPIPGGFLHWLVLGLPPADGAVPPVPAAARQDPEWRGPCPPPGSDPHHYRFTVYALNKDVQSRAEIKGAVIAQSTLVGTYRR